MVALPANIPIAGCEFGLRYNTRTFTSPLSQTVQRAATPGAYWFASYRLAPVNQADVAEIQSFLIQLQGRSITFDAYDPNHTVPRGAASVVTGTPVVDGAGQSGDTLQIRGLPLSVTGYLLPGDYFSVNGEFKMITANIDSDASGIATLNFAPALRNPPSDGVAIILSNPTCQMILTSDDMARWSEDISGFYSIGFAGREVFI